MEVTTLSLLRLVGLLLGFSLIHLCTRKIWKLDPTRENFSLASLAFLIALVFSTLHRSPTLLAVWTLLWLGLCVDGLLSTKINLPALAKQGQWIAIWGLTLAVPVSFLSQLNLVDLIESQDASLGRGWPAWAIVYNPFAFCLAVLALSKWVGETGATVSIRTPLGLLAALFLSVTTAAFLGGWHIPGFSGALLVDKLGEFQAGCVWWVSFVLKNALLWSLVAFLSRKPLRRKLPSALWLGSLAAGCLFLTWVGMAWKEIH
jgi:hypothetical protein